MFSNNLLMAAAGGGDAGYEVENSVHIGGGGKMSKTYGSAGDSRRMMTIHVWLKPGDLGGGYILTPWTDASNFTVVEFHSGDYFRVYQAISDSTDWHITTDALYRDPTSWFHAMIRLDTAKGTLTDGVDFWVNGVVVPHTVQTSMTTNRDTDFGKAIFYGIQAHGTEAAGGVGHGDLYRAQMIYQDGILGAATDAGEFDNQGYWRPIEITGLTFGTNGFFFDFADNTHFGNDVSGNGNDFTDDASMAAADQVPDSPTDNYCTLNPLQNNASSTLSDGNLKSTGGSNYSTQYSGTQMIFSGEKKYWEVTIGVSVTGQMYGIHKQTVKWHSDHTSSVSGDQVTLHHPTGDLANYYDTRYGTNYAPNGTVDVTVMIAVDLENDIIYWGDADNDLWSDGSGSYDQAWGTAVGENLTANLNWWPMGRSYAGTAVLNYGQNDFIGTPPTGFTGLKTSEKTALTFDPADHHQVELVNHDGTSTAFTCNWDADVYDTLFIIKNRDNVEEWYWVDGLNGYNKYLSSDAATTQTTDANVVTVSGTTITLGSTLLVDNYVIECHRAGAAGGAANSDGSITCTVSANTTTGFSIINHTGTAANATIGHGMGLVPKFTMSKNTVDTNNWVSYHVGTDASAPEDYEMTPDGTTARLYDTNMFNSTAPTSTLIYMGTNTRNNGSSDLIVTYAWAAVTGYSAFGSYEGNGLADGSMINVGFKPASVVLKSIDSTSNWCKYDTSREGYNVDNDRLNFDTTAAEGTADEIDILSNGVKMRIATDPNVNETYIYGIWGTPTLNKSETPAKAR